MNVGFRDCSHGHTPPLPGDTRGAAFTDKALRSVESVKSFDRLSFISVEGKEGWWVDLESCVTLGGTNLSNGRIFEYLTTQKTK